MSKIADFFENEQILITGGRGFVGRLLINKLLLSCSNLKKIILLVRKKNNENLELQKENLFNDELFENLKKKFPKCIEKVEFIESDCELDQLGLTQINKLRITQQVTIIFHCAANVKFDEDLKIAININIFGTLEVLNLAKDVRNLKALVYVSSSYSNCHRTIVEEKCYEPNVHYSTLLKLADNKFLKAHEKRILGDVGNTYFYSKAVAEQVVFEQGRGLPVAIYRPSAIMSTWREPIPGWTNKAFASTALVKGLILGYFPSILCTDDLIIDMVPADLTINALIAVTWDINNRYLNGTLSEPRVYNYVSAIDNPITFKSFISTIFKMIPDEPCSKSAWYPALYFNNTKLGNDLYSLSRPRLMVFMLRMYSILNGDKAASKRLQYVCKNYDLLTNLLECSLQKPCLCTNDNIRELWNDLSDDDKHEFFFNLKEFQWADYLKHYYKGLLQFIFKEENKPTQAAKAKKHYFKLRLIHLTVEALFYVTGICILSLLIQRWLNFIGVM